MISRRNWLQEAALGCGALLASADLLSAMGQEGSNGAASEFAWLQFLGPQRNGISAETGLLDQWPAGGPKVVWRAPGGVGMSGLVISDGQLLTMIEREGQQQLVSLSASDGKPQWQLRLAPAYRNAMGNGTRATPTIAGEQVFAFTGEGILAAVRRADGKLLWSKNVLDELKAEPAEYGMACSPLVVADQVIVSAGGPKGTVAAFDVSSGKRLWATGSEATGYSSPAMLNLAGQLQIVAFTGGALLGLAPGKGELLWRFPYETDFGCNIATPVAYKGQVFVSAGENHGAALVSLQKTAGGIEASEVWSSQGPKSVLRTEWQTAILLGDHLYGFDNVGAAGPVSHLTCIHAQTGERAWQQLRFGKGNMIAADGKLWISTMKGELVVVRASPKAYGEIGRGEVLGTTRQAPALANGLLYLRDDKEIVCLDVRKG